MKTRSTIIAVLAAIMIISGFDTIAGNKGKNHGRNDNYRNHSNNKKWHGNKHGNRHGRGNRDYRGGRNRGGFKIGFGKGGFGFSINLGRGGKSCRPRPICRPFRPWFRKPCRRPYRPVRTCVVTPIVIYLEDGKRFYQPGGAGSVGYIQQWSEYEGRWINLRVAEETVY